MSANPYPSGRLASLGLLTNAAEAVAEMTMEAVRRRQARRRKQVPKAGDALRPGPQTPLWNELATAVVQNLRRRGDKARLGRALGISRQRIHVLLVARTALPDAERALQLPAWINTTQRRPGSLGTACRRA